MSFDILDKETFWDHDFSKKEVVEISLHIYVPKGTKMVVRKSTWLNPLVDEQEALSLALPKKLVKKTSINKALAVVMDAQNDRDRIDKRVAEIHRERASGLSAPHSSAANRKSGTKLSKKHH